MDLNGLINTIIASTAALVAIIGGFLVSRVLALSSERVAVERRFNEIINDLNLKQNMLNEVEKIIFEEDVEEFIEDNYRELLLLDSSYKTLIKTEAEEITLKDIIETDKYTSLTVQDLEPYINQFVSMLKELVELIQKDISDSGTTKAERDFTLFIKGKKLSYPSKKYWYELIYDELFNEVFGVQDRFQAFTSFQSNVTKNFYQEKVKERENLEDEIRFLGMQKEVQNKIIQDYVKPKGLWGGLIVLVYACIVGIVYPSTLLPYPEKAYSVTLKWVLLGLFFSQLAALFTYLFISLYSLTKFSKRN